MSIKKDESRQPLPGVIAGNPMTRMREAAARADKLDDIRRRGLPRFEDGKCVVCGNAGCKCWGECPEGPRDDD